MLIDDNLIQRVTSLAKESPRLRKNYNFHETLDDSCQRMLNIMLKGTKFDIHRHTNTAESFVLLKGKLDLIYFNDKGEETDRFILDPLTGNYGIHIPAGQWHSLEIIEDSTIFETREGPYIPVSKENGLVL
ncbi:MAG: WbuC family cupin fold metalloprotein [Bacteroidaceae bacterium]|nr:WbuC family cupin fold metalloprotein [Bacteroidaceae bacterium]